MTTTKPTITLPLADVRWLAEAADAFLRMATKLQETELLIAPLEQIEQKHAIIAALARTERVLQEARR